MQNNTFEDEKENEPMPVGNCGVDNSNLKGFDEPEEIIIDLFDNSEELACIDYNPAYLSNRYMTSQLLESAIQINDYALKKVRERFNLGEKYETFQEMLLRLMEEKNLTPSECYNEAHIDRRHFRKIKENKYYMPRKNTVMAFAVALKLDLAEAEKLLKSAGYAFCESRPTDLVVREFIKRGEYDMHKINEVLYEFEEDSIGLY